MRGRIILFVILACFVANHSMANIVTKGAREIAEAILRKGGKEATEELAEYGGKQAIQEVLEKASREGGSELVERVIRYGKKYGVSAVRTIDNAPSLYVRSLDKLPEEMIERALWAAQRKPEVITRLVSDYGADALRVAAKHRGVGSRIVAQLGDDGVQMAKDLTEEQGVILARHADDIASLPRQQRNQVVDAIISAPKRTIDYMEKHPKVFGTAAGIATLVALKDEVFGTYEEVTTHPDGTKTVSKRGILERILDKFHTPLTAIIVVFAVIIGGWGAIKIWGEYRREKVRVLKAEAKLPENLDQSASEENEEKESRTNPST
jgi:precorrin-6x reductase